MIKFKSFSSGSCGNCYFLGVEEDGKITAGIMIDAGISLRRIKREFMAEHLDIEDFSAVLVTHDHLDHIRGLGSVCKHLHRPVYATPELLYALSHHTFTLDYIQAVKRPLDKDEWNEIVPGKIYVKYFVVPHDATQTVGYAIKLDGRLFVIITDVGKMTDEALSYASQADIVVIESNYDMDMLISGHYTYELKMRICKGNGHLSNDECAQAIKSFYHPGLKHIFLCHLSENNNTPQLALECNRKAIKEIGAEDAVTLRALPRQTASPMFTL